MLFLLLFNTLSLYAETDPTLAEELEKLKRYKEIGIITQEEYDFLTSSSDGEGGQNGLYSLIINNRKAFDFYRPKIQDEKTYFPILSFFDAIGQRVTTVGKHKATVVLENNQDNVEVDLKVKKVTDRKRKRIDLIESVNYIPDDTGEDFYLEEELFKELFLRSLKIDEQKLAIEMDTNFTTMDHQFLTMATDHEKFKEENEKQEVTFSNKRKLWELGYLHTDLMWTKEKGSAHEKRSQVEYQGALLYGTFITGYDFEEGSWNDTALRYKDIWKQHDFDIWRYESNEKGLTFKKKKGYYWNGKKYIITEDVPIGSTVELLYMGSVIDIQKAENGKVSFENSEIMENRTYTLKVYTPEGEILLRTIQTLRDYNQQLKGDIEFNIDIREQEESGGLYDNIFEVYYGLSDHITLGAQYVKTPEIVSAEEKWKYLEEFQFDFIYNNKIKNYPYILSAGYGEALSLYSNKSSYDFLGQIDIGYWVISAELEKFGDYYDEKLTKNFEIKYEPAKFYSIGYEYLHQQNYEDETLEEHKIKLSLFYSFRSFLATLNYNMSALTDKHEFDFNMYYNGFEHFSIIFNSSWESKFEDYDTKLTISNNRYYGPIDASLELRYSERYKEMLTAKFAIKLDDWFKIETSASKDGSRAISIGIDKVFDLRDIRKSVESLDSSRVKVTVFQDKNGNGIQDEDEPRLEYVEVAVGAQKIMTDSNGEAYFYGVPNDIRYDVGVVSPKPTHTVGKVRYSIVGKDNSTIEALIPIKTYRDISGTLLISENLKMSESELETLYSDILIEVKDSRGRILERVAPDESGEFLISNLLDNEYLVSVKYRGEKYEPENFSQPMFATGEPLFFSFDGKNIVLVREEEADE
jgi:hypothetical protein